MWHTLLLCCLANVSLAYMCMDEPHLHTCVHAERGYPRAMSVLLHLWFVCAAADWPKVHLKCRRGARPSNLVRLRRAPAQSSSRPARTKRLVESHRARACEKPPKQWQSSAWHQKYARRRCRCSESTSIPPHRRSMADCKEARREGGRVTPAEHLRSMCQNWGPIRQFESLMFGGTSSSHARLRQLQADAEDIDSRCD